MALDQKTIEYIAHLARLELKNTEEDLSIIEDLNHIMEMVNQISLADTNNIEPMAHPSELPQRLRKDEITTNNTRDVLIALSPTTEAGLYLVPNILE
jgi:aspartyl-tRNA(Asn)/glutamyl-tRNA(Gln) amidotransferase subunit C